MLSTRARYWLPLTTLFVIGDESVAQAPSAQSQALAPLEQPPVEEIIVGARRRDENSLRVGITLSAVEREVPDRGLMKSLPDLAASLANVELFDDYGGHGLPVWIIRGVGLQDFNANNTPAAAVYVDEVYQSSSVQGGSGLFDTERVEILKGPQGGLYGRNTSGGVIRQLTRRASLEGDDGYLSVGAGSWGDRTVEAATNQPLSEHLAVRVAGRINRANDAWQTSLSTGRSHGAKDLWDLRSWWLLEASERSRVELKLYAGRNDSELPLARSIGLYDASGNFCAAVLEGRRDDAHCLNYAGLVGVLNGAADPAPSPAIQKRNGATALSGTLNRLDNRQAGGTLLFTLDTHWQGLAAPQLQSITNIEDFDYGMSFDYDGSAPELGHQISSSAIASLSQELRLASTENDGFAWQVGALVSRDEFVEDRQFRLADNTPVGLVHGQLHYAQITRSRALYAQADQVLADKWTANGALRYTKEWKTYRAGRVLTPAFPPPYDVLIGQLDGDYELESHWSGSLGLNWQASAATMVYTSVSRGFKAGGFFGGFIFHPNEFAPYQEEIVLAYEAGFKSQLPEARLRLDAAVFFYDYRDVQGFANVVTGTAGAPLVLERLTSLGDAEHSGVDISLNWTPTERWAVNAGLGYLDARINSGGGRTVNILRQEVSTEGERPYAPHWSGNAEVVHARSIFRELNLQAGLSWHYRSDFSGTLTSAVDKAVSRLSGYGLMDAYVTLSPVARTWSLSLWGKNLRNKIYSPRKVYDSLGSHVEVMGQPRSWGLQARLDW